MINEQDLKNTSGIYKIQSKIKPYKFYIGCCNKLPHRKTAGGFIWKYKDSKN